MAKQQITITMAKSQIATNPKQRETLKGLGLNRRGRTRVIEDTAANRGMIKKVIHLLDIKKGDTTVKKEKKSFYSVKEASSTNKTAEKSSAKKTTKKKTTSKSTTTKKTTKKA